MLIPSDYTNQQYSPDTKITRREITVMADRALGLVYPASQPLTETLPFTDTEQIPIWVRGYVNEAVKAGVLTGYPNGTFRAWQTATRAEAVIMVARVKETMEQGVSASLPDDQKINIQVRFFGELRKSDCYYNTSAPLDYHGDYQIIDGVIYIDEVEITEQADLLVNSWQRGSSAWWKPDRLAWSFEYGYLSIDIIAGYREECPTGADTLPANRMLNGRIMTPAYSLEDGTVVRGPWAAYWEESIRTLTVHVYWQPPYGS